MFHVSPGCRALGQPLFGVVPLPVCAGCTVFSQYDFLLHLVVESAYHFCHLKRLNAYTNKFYNTLTLHTLLGTRLCGAQGGRAVYVCVAACVPGRQRGQCPCPPPAARDGPWRTWRGARLEAPCGFLGRRFLLPCGRVLMLPIVGSGGSWGSKAGSERVTLRASLWLAIPGRGAEAEPGVLEGCWLF